MSMVRRGKWPLRFLVVLLGMIYVLFTVEAQDASLYWVAFVAAEELKEYKTHLYLVKSDGSDLHKVTPIDPLYDNALAWSHDGQWIAYVYEGDLYRLNIDEGTPELLLDNEPIMKAMGYPLDEIFGIARTNMLRTSPFKGAVWSSDDSSLYLVAQRNWGLSGLARNVFRLDIPSRALTKLTHLVNPSFVTQITLTPDNILVYSVGRLCDDCFVRGGQLYSMALTGEWDKFLLSRPDLWLDKDPFWLPAKGRLYLLHKAEDNGGSLWQVQSIMLDGSDRYTVADFDARDTHLLLVNESWIYAYMYDSESDVYSTSRVPIDGGAWQKIVDGSIGYPSPDGEQLVVPSVQSLVFSRLINGQVTETGSVSPFYSIFVPVWSPVPMK